MCTRKTIWGRTCSACSYLCQVALILSISYIARASVIPSPVIPYGNDTIRTPDGFQCSSSVSPSSYLDAGIYHEDDGKYDEPDRGVYVRILVPLYTGVKRLDCSKLYEQSLKDRERDRQLQKMHEDIFKSPP